MAGSQDVARECAALRTRMAARKVTRAYDEALRPVGLRVTQFTLLVAIQLGAPESISQLAEIAALERTTLTRNLGILQKEGLVDVGPEGYRRARSLRLTEDGEARLEEALPLWEAAQNRLVERMGQDRWSQTKSLLDELAGAI